MNNVELTENPNTPPETLNILANDKNLCVRLRVEINPNAPPEALERLANEEDFWVRYWVAENPNTPQYFKSYLKFMD